MSSSTTKHPTAETIGVPVAPEMFEQQYVYGSEPQSTQRQNPMRTNRPAKPRKRSSFMLIMLLVMSSLFIVAYVWNKITVSRLMEEVGVLETQYQKIIDANNTVQAEINQKSRLERIGKLATDVGMTYPKEPPVWFEVDLENVEQSFTVPQ